MKCSRLLALPLSLLGASALAAPMTNEDVIKMVKAGLDEGIIITSIQNSEPKFDASPDGLIGLSEAKVPKTVVTALIQRASGKASEAALAESGEPGQPAEGPAVNSVMLVEESGVMEMKYSTPGHATRVRGMGFGGAGSYLSLSGTRATLRVKTRAPTFKVWVPRNAQPEQQVQLTVWAVRNNGTREIIQANVGGMGQSVRSGFPKERLMAVELVPTGETGLGGYYVQYAMRPKAPLGAGEYAVVMQGSLCFDFGVDP